MLERIENLPEGLVGMKAIGKVTKADYDRVFEPLVEDARASRQRMRFLYELGPELEGFTAGGVWEDARLGLQSMRYLAGCAVVTDLPWVREAVRVMGFMMPCPMRVFGVSKRDEAIAWLGALPEDISIAHRLIPDLGVIVVEVKEPLRVEDFDRLTATTNAWLDSHGELNGLVLQMHEFRGWETFGSFVRHLRFISEHEERIDRVALVADTKLVRFVPRIAEHFVKAEVKSFEEDEVEQAIAWASHRTHGEVHAHAS